MRDRVNVSIDHRLKMMFEDLREIHGKEWNEWFEEATIDFLTKVDPVQTLEYLIKQDDEKQDERRQALIRTKQNIAILNMQKSDREKNETEKRRQLQELRLELFEKEFESLEHQWKYQHLNWTRLIDFGKFNDMKEAKTWLENELKKRGIMPKNLHYQ